MSKGNVVAESAETSKDAPKFRISSVLDQINPLTAASAIVACTVLYMQFEGLRKNMESVHADNVAIRDKLVAIDGRANQISDAMAANSQNLELRFQIIDEKMKNASERTDQKIAHLFEQMQRMRNDIKERANEGK